MICSSCHHIITRRYQNGQDITLLTFCDIDGYLISNQLKECSRKEEKVIVEVPTEVKLPSPPQQEIVKRGKRR